VAEPIASASQSPLSKRATRRKIMKYTLRAAIAALSIGSIPPAMAGEGGSNPNTVATEIPGVIPHAPGQTEQQRQSAQTQSGHGGWLFAPIGNYLNQRAG
jgi:hypothetical protein